MLYDQYVFFRFSVDPLWFVRLITATRNRLTKQLIHLPYASFDFVYILIGLHIMLLIFHVVRLFTSFLSLLAFRLGAIRIVCIQIIVIVFIAGIAALIVRALI